MTWVSSKATFEGDLPGREDRVVDVLLLHRGNHDAGVRYLAGREPDLPGRGGALSVHRGLAMAPGGDRGDHTGDREDIWAA